MPPWIADPDPGKHAQLLRSRIKLVDSTIVVAHNPVDRLHLGMQEDALLEIQPSSGTSPPGADGVVAVLDPEAGQRQLLHVSDIIPVGIPEEEDIRGLGDVTSAICQRDTRRHVKTVSEHGRFVGFAVIVAVLKDDYLVVGLVSRLQLRVGPGAGHPQATTGIPGHVDRVGQHRLGGKQVDLVTGQQREVGLLHPRVMVAHQAGVRISQVLLTDAICLLSRGSSCR